MTLNPKTMYESGDESPEHFIYLGPYQNDDAKYDLWWGPIGAPKFSLTLIARWSPNGPDYSSGMCFGWIDSPGHPLVEARKRAQLLGLDCQTDQYENRLVQTTFGFWADKDADLSIFE